MKRFKKTDTAKGKRERQLKRLKVLLILLVIAIIGAGITIYRDFQARPGFLEKIWIADRGADSITIAWERPRNVHKFVITYNGKRLEVSGKRKGVKITGLTEDTEYKFTVRADSKQREGFEALEEKARTKKTQIIKGETKQTRFANRPVDLKQTAETELTYAPGNGYQVTEEGKIIFTKGGKITVKAEAAATEEYAAATKKIHVEVLDTFNTDADGAKQHIFYKLDSGNCKRLRSITGTKKQTTPQAFIYTKGQYYVTYVNKENDQRLVRFGDKKKTFKPKADLGHANGLTIADGVCYSVSGADNVCIIFDPPNSNYFAFDMAYDASGIAYDEISKKFFTSSRDELVAYDGNFSVVNHVGRVKRKGKFYVQDCAAYSDILMQGVSGKDAKGTNYIDFYDMEESKYLGSIECELGEVESLLVNEEGYIEVLSNVKGTTDIIWKTPINMKKLCE